MSDGNYFNFNVFSASLILIMNLLLCRSVRKGWTAPCQGCCKYNQSCPQARG